MLGSSPVDQHTWSWIFLTRRLEDIRVGPLGDTSVCIHDERVERGVFLVAVGKVLLVLRRLFLSSAAANLFRVWWQATEEGGSPQRR